MQSPLAKKLIVAILIVSIMFALGFPVLLSIVLYWKNPFPVGDTPTWVGFLGNYFGAIIGGAISAFVTIYGIMYTLQQDRIRHEKQQQLEETKKLEEERLKFADKFPAMLRSIDSIIDKVEELMDRLESDERSSIEIDPFLDNLVNEALEVDVNVFRQVKDFAAHMQRQYKYVAISSLRGVTDHAEVEKRWDLMSSYCSDLYYELEFYRAELVNRYAQYS